MIEDLVTSSEDLSPDVMRTVAAVLAGLHPLSIVVALFTGADLRYGAVLGFVASMPVFALTIFHRYGAEAEAAPTTAETLRQVHRARQRMQLQASLGGTATEALGEATLASRAATGHAGVLAGTG